MTQKTYGVEWVKAALLPTHSYMARWRFMVCGRTSFDQRPSSPAFFQAALSMTAGLSIS